MMGYDFGDAILKIACAMLAVGALVGIGCNAGCGYLREHVNVEWKQ